MIEAALEQGTIGQPGQAVVVGDVHQSQLCALAFDGMAQGAGNQVSVSLSLDQIVLRAFLHDLDRCGFVIETAEYDNGDILAYRLDPPDGLQRVGIGHRDIGQHDIECPLFKLFFGQGTEIVINCENHHGGRNFGIFAAPR